MSITRVYSRDCRRCAVTSEKAAPAAESAQLAGCGAGAAVLLHASRVVTPPGAMRIPYLEFLGSCFVGCALQVNGV